MHDQATDFGTTRGASAIVADHRPLERALLVFLLEEQGVHVAGEADAMADVLSLVERHAPDVVVIHERFALDHRPAVLARIRRLSPQTDVAIFASGGDVAPFLVLAADVIVKDAEALSELARTVARRGGILPPLDREEDGAEPEPPVPVDMLPGSGSRSGGRWGDRLQGVVAATTFVALLVLVRGDLMPIATAPPAAKAHLVAAYTAYEQLDAVASTSTPGEISAIAQSLLLQRHLAIAGGANVSDLDVRVKELVLRLVSTLPRDAASSLVLTLGPLFTEDAPTSLQYLEQLLTPASPAAAAPTDPPVTEPPPTPMGEPTHGSTPADSTPEAEPSPTPGEEVTTTPSQDPSPTPTEDPSSTPTEDPSPTPSEETSPLPDEPPAPTEPSESPTDETDGSSSTGEADTATEETGTATTGTGTATTETSAATEKTGTATVDETATATVEIATAP